LLGFVVFLLTKNRTVLHIAILPMFFYGVLGLFVFPWKGINIIPQIGHIIMTLNIFCLIFVTFSTADYKSATIGTLLGIALFSIFIAFQQNFAATHQQDLKRVLGISLYSSVPQDPNPDEPELKRKNNE
jgi:ABC-type Fe3+-siderophore transport system permease subunit